MTNALESALRPRVHRGGRAATALAAVGLCALALLAAAPALAVVPAAQPAQGLVLKSGDQGLWMAGLKSIAIAVIALGAAAASLYWLRGRIAPRRLAALRGADHLPAPLLQGSRRIGQHTVLLVVQWDDRVYLLAESAGGTHLLDSRALGVAPAAHGVAEQSGTSQPAAENRP